MSRYCPICHGRGIELISSMSLEGEYDREQCWSCLGRAVVQEDLPKTQGSPGPEVVNRPAPNGHSPSKS